jgi:hypothetical protein
MYPDGEVEIGAENSKSTLGLEPFESPATAITRRFGNTPLVIMPALPRKVFLGVLYV